MKRYINPLLLLFFYALLAITLLAPIAANNFIPNTADFVNHVASIVQAKMALIENQFPLQIAPFERSGWRYPLFQFNSPTSYTFAGIIYRYITTQNPFMAYKVTLWVAMTLSGIFMYRLAFWMVRSKPAAILTGVIYLTSPFFILLVDRWGGFNEAVAQGLLPMVIYFTLRRYHTPTQSYLLFAALSWYLLATIHLITFVYASFFISLLLLIDTCIHRERWINLFRTGLAYVFGCLLAAWFLIPVATFSNVLKIQGTLQSPSLFNRFTPLSSLISFAATSPIPLEGVYRPASSPVHPAIGWPILISVGICFYAILNRSFLKKDRGDQLILPLLIIFMIAFFMAWSPFDFWVWLPKILNVAQYSWRLLGQVTWIGSLLFAFAICWLFNNRLSSQHVVIGTLILTLATASWLPMMGKSQTSLQALIKNPELGFSRNDYLIDVTKYPKYIDSVENLLLESAYPNSKLVLDQDILIPKKLLNTAYSPNIHLEGTITEETSKLLTGLRFFIDGKLITTHEIKPGNFKWEIPFKNPSHSEKFVKLRFSAVKKDQKTPILISIKNITLNGFFNPSKEWAVNKIQPYCTQHHSTKHCQILVPSSVSFLELPIIYYPGLLQIKINGHPVKYHSVLHQYLPLVGVQPESGKINDIKINYQGIVWANWMSRVSWGIWILAFCILGFQKIRSREKISESSVECIA